MGDDSSTSTKLDHTSPYYLGSQDGTSIKITDVVFRGNYYDEWSRSIRLSLRARRKFGFVEGTIPKPKDGDARLDDWICIQSTIVQWLLMTISDSVKKTMPFIEEAKPLWDALKRRYAVGNGPRRQQLKVALADCRQTSGMSVAEYFGLLQPLWDELAIYSPLPHCKYGKCSCNLGGIFQKRLDEDRLHDFLYGLNDDLYGTVRSTLFAQTPPPDLDRAYQALLQEERIRSSSRARAERDDVLALAVRTPTVPSPVRPQYSAPASSRSTSRVPDRSSASSDPRGLVCTFCKQKGHTEPYCFTKRNAWPEWWGDKPKYMLPSQSASSNGPSSSHSVAVLQGATLPAAADQPTASSTSYPRLFGNIQPHDDRLLGPKFEDSDWSR